MSNPYQSPPPVSPTPPFGTGPGQVTQGDSTGGMIPYKNPKALTAYYLGILSLLCCFFGVPLGIAPFVLGILGLRDRARNPVIKGSVHAWIGIVLGAISTLASIFILVMIVVGIVSKGR